MHIYFVRHGETDLGAKRIHQSPSTSLSIRGKQQIETTAEYLRDVNPDFLISSEYTRTRESADIIGAHVNLKPVVNELFYEMQRPSKFFGASIFNFETVWYVLLSCVHLNNPTWHYADAESFSDVVTRAKRAQTYLESLQDTHQSVIVVSHSVFITIVTTSMCVNRAFTFFDIIHIFISMLRMQNGGMIHLEYSKNTATNMNIWSNVKDA